MDYRTFKTGFRIDHHNVNMDVAVHPNDSGKIVLYCPGAGGDLEGYSNRNVKISNLLQEKIASVVRMDNLNPVYGADKLFNLHDYALKNAKEICGTDDPEFYLMGFSLGGGIVADMSSALRNVTKVLLMNGVPMFRDNYLRFFKGDVYILTGDEDNVSGCADFFYEIAEHAESRKIEVIPECDHEFTGAINEKYLSAAPLWAFGGYELKPENGVELYTTKMRRELSRMFGLRGR